MIEPAKEQIAELCERHGVQLLVLFGSRGTGDETGKSDVDLAALFDRHLTARESWTSSMTCSDSMARTESTWSCWTRRNRCSSPPGYRSSHRAVLRVCKTRSREYLDRE
ncbi:MAG: nucleotidyltransferase domain-containing protein [Actinobacteria bacterium]|nr:MAG: nucleotidyltransferase domain-containing protein [Actinomycetota bacterium]